MISQSFTVNIPAIFISVHEYNKLKSENESLKLIKIEYDKIKLKEQQLKEQNEKEINKRYAIRAIRQERRQLKRLNAISQEETTSNTAFQGKCCTGSKKHYAVL